MTDQRKLCTLVVTNKRKEKNDQSRNKRSTTTSYGISG